MDIFGRDVNRAGDQFQRIELGVDFDGRLGGAKPRPGKHAQARIDRRGVERINRLIQRLDAAEVL